MIYTIQSIILSFIILIIGLFVMSMMKTRLMGYVKVIPIVSFFISFILFIRHYLVFEVLFDINISLHFLFIANMLLSMFPSFVLYFYYLRINKDNRIENEFKKMKIKDF